MQMWKGKTSPPETTAGAPRAVLSWAPARQRPRTPTDAQQQSQSLQQHHGDVQAGSSSEATEHFTHPWVILSCSRTSVTIKLLLFEIEWFLFSCLLDTKLICRWWQSNPRKVLTGMNVGLVHPGDLRLIKQLFCTYVLWATSQHFTWQSGHHRVQAQLGQRANPISYAILLLLEPCCCSSYTGNPEAHTLRKLPFPPAPSPPPPYHCL